MPDTTLAPPTIPSGKDIYTAIMSKIEPELLPDCLPNLKEKYKDETPEQNAERAKKYEQAFAEYDKQYTAFMADLEAKVRAYQHEAIASVEKEDRANDDLALQNLESSIAAA